jgi:hypothetical protein
MTLVVVALTLAGVAFGRSPFVPLDRAGFALVGAAALLATGVLDLDGAAALVDVAEFALLFGSMPLNEALAEPARPDGRGTGWRAEHVTRAAYWPR